MSTPILPARTYNQNHVARKYTAGKRRLSIYWTWSYPWESQRDPAAMENRFSTMTEVRRVAWPHKAWACHLTGHRIKSSTNPPAAPHVRAAVPPFAVVATRGAAAAMYSSSR